MADNISVRISADVTELTAQLAVARANLSDTSAELRKMATEMRDAGSGATDQMKAGLLQAAEAAAKARSEVSQLNAQLKQSGGTGFLQHFSEEFEGAFAPIKAIQTALLGIAEVVAGAFAVREVAEWAQGVAEAGVHVGHLAQQVGLSVEDMSRLSGAMTLIGQNTDSAGTMIERLERNMVAAENGSKTQAAAFAALNISAAELKNLSIDQVLDRIADAFSKAQDGPEKTAIAMALMGRGGAEMIPVLDRGAQGLAEFKARADEAGAGLTGPMLEGMERTEISFNELGLAAKGIGISMFEVLKPGIDATVTGLVHLIEEMNESIRTGGSMAEVVKVIAAAFNAIVIVCESVTLVVQVVWDKIVTGAQAASDALHGNFGKAFADFEEGWKRQQKLTDDYFASLKRLVGNAGSDLGAIGAPEETKKPKLDASGLTRAGGAGAGGGPGSEAIAQAREQISEITAITDLGKSEQLQREAQTWEILLSGDKLNAKERQGVETNLNHIIGELRKQEGADAITALKAANAEILTDTSLLKGEQLQREIQNDDRILASDELTAEQRVQIERERTAMVAQLHQAESQEAIAALREANAQILANTALTKNQQIQLEIQGDNQLLAQAVLTAEARKQIETQRAQFERQLHQETLREETAAMRSQFQEITSAENTLIRGIFSGRQSLTQSLINMGADFVQKEIANDLKALTAKLLYSQTEQAALGKDAQGGVLMHLWAELTKTNATAAGEAARTAIKTEAATTASALEVAQGTVQISNAALKAAAGAYSAVAGIPIVGPILAPIAAGVAFTAVEAFSALKSFDVGTNYVPRNMIAMVHEGERIVPAADNARLLQATQAQANVVHLNYSPNINAPQQKTLTELMSRESRSMLNWVQAVVRNGSLKPT